MSHRQKTLFSHCEAVCLSRRMPRLSESDSCSASSILVMGSCMSITMSSAAADMSKAMQADIARTPRAGPEQLPLQVSNPFSSLDNADAVYACMLRHVQGIFGGVSCKCNDVLASAASTITPQ